MTPQIQINQQTQVSQNEFYALISEKMRAAIRLTLMAIMDAEVEAFVGAPHGLPSATRWDYRIHPRFSHHS